MRVRVFPAVAATLVTAISLVSCSKRNADGDLTGIWGASTTDGSSINYTLEWNGQNDALIGECAPFTLTLKDQANMTETPSPIFLPVALLSSVGQYYSDSACDQPVTAVIFYQGDSSKNFYYRSFQPSAVKMAAFVEFGWPLYNNDLDVKTPPVTNQSVLSYAVSPDETQVAYVREYKYSVSLTFANIDVPRRGLEFFTKALPPKNGFVQPHPADTPVSIASGFGANLGGLYSQTENIRYSPDGEFLIYKAVPHGPKGKMGYEIGAIRLSDAKRFVYSDKMKALEGKTTLPTKVVLSKPVGSKIAARVLWDDLSTTVFSMDVKRNELFRLSRDQVVNELAIKEVLAMSQTGKYVFWQTSYPEIRTEVAPSDGSAPAIELPGKAPNIEFLTTSGFYASVKDALSVSNYVVIDEINNRAIYVTASDGSVPAAVQMTSLTGVAALTTLSNVAAQNGFEVCPQMSVTQAMDEIAFLVNTDGNFGCETLYTVGIDGSLHSQIASSNQDAIDAMRRSPDDRYLTYLTTSSTSSSFGSAIRILHIYDFQTGAHFQASDQNTSTQFHFVGNTLYYTLFIHGGSTLSHSHSVLVEAKKMDLETQSSEQLGAKIHGLAWGHYDSGYLHAIQYSPEIDASIVSLSIGQNGSLMQGGNADSLSSSGHDGKVYWGTESLLSDGRILGRITPTEKPPGCITNCYYPIELGFSKGTHLHQISVD